ncbi:hypothetical protein [Photobacterium leiognathi]|uniref:hypothetical protein n=1 Tax=Photobacterium leiognathi TaxID=553611 RepID=UPI0027340105|nr:hypothetical protein [Photobacterium leiognathi]
MSYSLNHYYIAYFNKSCTKATSLAYYIDGVITDNTISYLLEDVPCLKVLESGAIYLIEAHAYSDYPKDKLVR